MRLQSNIQMKSINYYFHGAKFKITETMNQKLRLELKIHYVLVISIIQSKIFTLNKCNQKSYKNHTLI